MVNRPRSKRSFLAVLLFLFELVFLDLCAGSLYRFYNSRFPARESKVQIKSPVFHHTLAPLKDEVQFWGTTRTKLITNSLGMRDKERRIVELKPGRYRVVIIGDSFTEGVGVEYEESFAGLLDGFFSKRNIEVLNAGVSSYSPLTYYRKVKYLLEDAGLEMHELLVMIDVSDIQDEALCYRLRGEDQHVESNLDACLERYGLRKGKLYCGGCSFPEARRLITPETREIPANGALWSRLWGKLEFRSITVIAFNKLLDYWLAQPHNVAAEPEQQFRGRWPNDPEIFGVYGEEGLRRAGEHMKMLLALLQRHSVKLTIAVYPWPYQIAERDLDSLQVEFWRTWTAANQVDFIDCFPSFINQTAPQKILEQYYFKGDVHWNSKGHRVVADALSAHYQSRMRQHHIQ